MIAYIVTIIVLVLILNSMLKDQGITWKEYWPLLSFFPLMMSCVVGFGVFMILHCFASEHMELVEENSFHTPIASLNNTDYTSGSFFLGCGSVNSSEYYVYFMKKDDGGFKRGMTLARIATVYEKDEEPRIVWKMVTLKQPWWSASFIKSVDTTTVRSGDYQIIVPPNTIIKEFDIK